MLVLLELVLMSCSGSIIGWIWPDLLVVATSWLVHLFRSVRSALHVLISSISLLRSDSICVTLSLWTLLYDYFVTLLAALCCIIYTCLIWPFRLPYKTAVFHCWMDIGWIIIDCWWRFCLISPASLWTLMVTIGDVMGLQTAALHAKWSEMKCSHALNTLNAKTAYYIACCLATHVRQDSYNHIIPSF